ncbi:hypothetical protein ACFVY1_05525 [Streptomyces sp. NPDC058293]|uniref:hypothetical protein n=1 Tax=Streptomyces sp. NPDC058293 TaxID=3346429 RepID=UPI0036ED2CE4
MTGDDGQPAKGEWEPINTLKEWEAVCAAIAERKQQRPGKSPARKYLLFGITRWVVQDEDPGWFGATTPMP